jgi:hypothetical protein
VNDTFSLLLSLNIGQTLLSRFAYFLSASSLFAQLGQKQLRSIRTPFMKIPALTHSSSQLKLLSQFAHIFLTIM